MKNGLHICFGTLIAALLFLSCGDAVHNTSYCELTAPLRFHNRTSQFVSISFLDSTRWDTLTFGIEADSFSHKEDTTLVSPNSEAYDTLFISWEFEHHDIFDDSEP